MNLLIFKMIFKETNKLQFILWLFTSKYIWCWWWFLFFFFLNFFIESFEVSRHSIQFHSLSGLPISPHPIPVSSPHKRKENKVTKQVNKSKNKRPNKLKQNKNHTRNRKISASPSLLALHQLFIHPDGFGGFNVSYSISWTGSCEAGDV